MNPSGSIAPRFRSNSTLPANHPTSPARLPDSAMRRRDRVEGRPLSPITDGLPYFHRGPPGPNRGLNKYARRWVRAPERVVDTKPLSADPRDAAQSLQD